MAKKTVKIEKKNEPLEEKPKEQKVKLSLGQKDRLRKKRKRIREYLEKNCPRIHPTNQIKVLMNHFAHSQVK